MGGTNSGRRGGRPTADGCPSIDMALLRRRRAMAPGCFGALEWSLNGQPYASVGYRTQANLLILNYRHRPHCPWGDGAWEDVEERIILAWEPCRFGGQRPFSVCPGCGRDVLKLYVRGRTRCRQCFGLAYHSQRQDCSGRLRNRADKIRKKLCGEPGGLMTDLPPKPKGMHWRTYDRLIREIEDFEGQLIQMLASWLGRREAKLSRARM